MKAFERCARALGFALLMVAWTDPGAAEFAAPTTDGWHVWAVEAPAERADELASDTVNIYVRISDGKVTRIRARTDDCPVSFKTAALEHGAVATQESVNWLARQVDDNTQIAEDAMAAISAHSADAALPALTAILEDRTYKQKTREQALFWLAQIPSNAAFEYLDRLLSHNPPK